MNLRRLLTAVLLLTVGLAPTAAHNVTPDPVVDVFVKPVADHLTAELRLPVAVLVDANLPRDPDGRFAQVEMARALDLVARGMARDLEFRQGDELLALPAVLASLSSDEGTVLINLEYLIRGDHSRLSARLHSFRAGGRVVRTYAHYVVDARTIRTFSIAGAPERVTFEPSRTEVAVRFLRRGTDLLLSTGDYFLFALCLIAPRRRMERLARACATLLGSQALAIAAAGFGWLTLEPDTLLAVQAVAASAIVVAAIQDLVSPESPWLWPLALVFGLTNGLSIGDRFASESAFAGSHLTLGLFVWLLAVEVGVMWVIAVLASAAALLRRRGLAVQLTVLALSIVAGHASLHRLVDRGQSLAELGGVSLEHLLVLVVLVWACVILCAGILETAFVAAMGTGPRKSLAHARPRELK